MKKALSVLGGLFLVLLLAGGGMVAYAAFEGSKLDAESKAYVEATLPRVLSNPTSENFLSFMPAKEKEHFNSAEMEKFGSYMNLTLGAFQSCDNVKGDSLLMLSSPNGESITARYLARCHFNKASITASISLRKTGDAWGLLGVHFDTDTLEPAAPASRRASALESSRLL